MKVTRFLILSQLLAVLASTTISCTSKGEKMVKGGDFSTTYQKAIASKKPFCIVIARNECGVCEYFFDAVQNQQGNIKQTFFYFIDADLTENRWVEQWLCQRTTPCTCIFSGSGKLTSIVMGSREASIQQINECIGDSTLYNLQFFPSYLATECRDSILSLYNSTLQAYLSKDDNIQAAISHINTSLGYYRYFFNLYLKSKLEVKLNPDSSTYYAQKALDIINPQVLYYYSDLRNELRAIVDSTFNPADEPTLSLSESTVNIGECALEEKKVVTLKLKNIGKKALSIYDVNADCNCTQVSWTHEPIAGGASSDFTITYTPDQKGFIKKKITIFSNALNPVVALELSGVVK